MLTKLLEDGAGGGVGGKEGGRFGSPRELLDLLV